MLGVRLFSAVLGNTGVNDVLEDLSAALLNIIISTPVVTTTIVSRPQCADDRIKDDVSELDARMRRALS